MAPSLEDFGPPPSNRQILLIESSVHLLGLSESTQPSFEPGLAEVSRASVSTLAHRPIPSRPKPKNKYPSCLRPLRPTHAKMARGKAKPKQQTIESTLGMLHLGHPITSAKDHSDMSQVKVRKLRCRRGRHQRILGVSAHHRLSLTLKPVSPSEIRHPI